MNPCAPDMCEDRRMLGRRLTSALPCDDESRGSKGSGNQRFIISRDLVYCHHSAYLGQGQQTSPSESVVSIFVVGVAYAGKQLAHTVRWDPRKLNC